MPSPSSSKSPSLSPQQQQEALEPPAEGRSSDSNSSSSGSGGSSSFAKFISRAVGLRGKSEKKGGRSSLPALFVPKPKGQQQQQQQHPMTLRDFAWFRMDTRKNLVVINTVLKLRAGPGPGPGPGPPPTVEAVAAAVERRLLPHFPRLRQRVVARSLRGAQWREDEAFDLSNHVRAEEQRGGETEGGADPSSPSLPLEDRVARLASAPIDRRRPLWELVLLSPSPEQATVVLLLRVHHCLTDGIGLMSVLDRLLTTTAAAADDDDDDGEGEERGERAGRETAATATAAATTAAVPQPRSLSSPPAPAPSPSPALLSLKTLGTAARVALSWPHGPRPRGAFRAPAPLSGRKRFAWSSPPPLELERLRAAARRSGVTINDLFVAAAAAALRRYFSLESDGDENKNKKKKKDRVRAFVTFSLRHEGRRPKAPSRLGNEFGLVAVDLPTHLACPRARLREANGSMARAKASREPHGVAALLSLAGLAPNRRVQSYFLKEFTKKGTVVLSNVRGPPAVLAADGKSNRELAGASVTDVIVFVPQTGDLGASFGLFSFAGRAQLSLAADESLVRDPWRLMGLLGEAFEELEKAGELAEEDEKKEREKEVMRAGGDGGGAEMMREE